MRPETGTGQPRCVQWLEGHWSVFLPTRLPSRPKCACTALSFRPKTLPPDKHIRSISNVNPIDEDFSDSVEPVTVELNLGRLELWGRELEVACVGPIPLPNPPSALVRNFQTREGLDDFCSLVKRYFYINLNFKCIPVLDIIKPVVQILVQNSRLK